MHVWLGALVVLFNLADNATTFLCLRAPVPGFEVVEANPAAAWLFETVGLRQGLLLEICIDLREFATDNRAHHPAREARAAGRAGRPAALGGDQQLAGDRGHGPPDRVELSR